jgi:hypothetical protein
MVPDGNYVAVLECVLLDQLTVDVRAVGAVQVFEKGIVQDVDHERVMTADRRIVDADVVVRQTPDGVTLFAHVVLGEHLPVETENKPGHARSCVCR